MKQFFIKIGTLLLIVFLLSKTIRAFLPYMFTTSVHHAKEMAFHEQKAKADLIFLGTSRTNYGIDPKIFEQEVKKRSSKQLYTYNYGIAGSSMGEIVALTKQVLQDDAFKGQFLMVELSSFGRSLEPQFCGDRNLHTNRNIYWNTTDMLNFSIKSTVNQLSNKYVFFDKLRFIKNYLVGYVHNQFNIAMYEDFIQVKTSKKQKLQAFRLSEKGYRPNKGKNKKGNPEVIKKWIKKELEPAVQRRKKASIETFGNDNANFLVNENYLNELESLILLADTKGINLIFLVPPLIHENFYAELKSIYDRLPARQKIEVTNAKKYAKLYEVENVYDPVHLNEKGIAIYSKLVAEKFVEITQIKADKKGQKNNIGNKNTNNKKQEDGDKKLNKTEKEKQTNLKNKRKQGKNTHEKKPLDKNN